jgi:hypothetical protein
MPNEGTKREKYPAAPPVTVTIEHGTAKPKSVDIHPRGAVQFDNKDHTDYRVRLRIRNEERHPDIDILLAGFGSATFMVDPDVDEGECEYQLFETNLDDLAPGQNAAVAGRIVIGPNPKNSG